MRRIGNPNPDPNVITKHYERSEYSAVSYKNSAFLPDNNSNSSRVYAPKQPQASNKHDNNSSTREVFDQNVPIRLRSDALDQTINLRIHLVVLNEKNNSRIQIDITNDNDFLKESDYLQLRNSQQIKVDFSGFPDMLVKQYLTRLQNPRDVHHDTSYYHAIFNIRKSEATRTLSFIESNIYKDSELLRLEFKQASDQQVKDYLADKLRLEKDITSSLRSNNAELQEQLGRRLNQIQVLRVENQRANDIKISELNSQQSAFLQEKRRLEEKEMELHRRGETQRRELLLAQEQKLKQLNQANDSLTKTNTSQKARIIELQLKERDLEQKLSFLNAQYALCTKQLDEVRISQKKLQAQKHEYDKRNTQLSCQVAKLETQLREKASLVQTSVELKETANSQVQQLQTRMEDAEKKCIKLQAKLKEVSEELTRVSTQFEEARRKIEKNKEKLKERANCIKSLDQIIEENTRKGETLLKENSQLKGLVKQLKTKVEQQEKDLSEKSKLVDYLNNQVNEKSAAFKLMPTYTGVTGSYSLGVGGLATTGGLTSTLGTTGYSGTAGMTSTSPLGSRLRTSTSPLGQPRGQQFEVRRYVRDEFQVPLSTTQGFPRSSNNTAPGFNQQLDPEQSANQISNVSRSGVPGARVKPVKYRQD